jgi:hypothetical protein
LHLLFVFGGTADMLGAIGGEVAIMSEEQLGLGLNEVRREDRPLFDPNEIREDCLELIAEARRNGPELIWDADTLNYRRILFPNLASWLPDEAERNQLCFEFAQELERIQLLLAA